jgi:hypothetical protein
MKQRSLLLTLLAIVQWVLAALCAFAAFAMLQERAAEVASCGDCGRNAAEGFSIGAMFCVLAAFGMASFGAGIGLWRLRLWGQWLAVVIFALWVAALSYAWYDDDWDTDLLAVLIPFIVIFAVHLLPTVWRAFRSAKLESPASTI